MQVLVNRWLLRFGRGFWLAPLAALALGQPARGNPLPNLGDGDPGLLVGLAAPDQRIWVIARERKVYAYPDFANGKNVDFLETADGVMILYDARPEKAASILFGSAEDIKQQCSTFGNVFRCFPLGPGRGMLQLGSQPGNPTMVSWRGNIPMATVMSSDELKSFGVQPGELILGEIDGKRFYWNAKRATVVVVRDLENRLVGEWKVPRLASADGVVRGLANTKSVAVVGWFKSQGLIKWGGQADYAIVDIESYESK